MTQSLTALLLATVCISPAYATVDAATTKLVFNQKELLAAVQNPHYTTVKVVGIIKDVSNVELHDGLTLEGATADTSGLIATANSPLLIVGKNNTIKNLSLTQQGYVEPRVIHNRDSSSVGNLLVEKVKTNGAIDIAVTDGSTDSTVTLQHNVTHFARYATTAYEVTGGIILTVDNKSQLTVNDVSFNEFSTLPGNMGGAYYIGVYNRAYGDGIIHYKGGLTHNTINTHEEGSIGFYNYADGGHIKIAGPIQDNDITVEASQTQAVYNHADENGSIEIPGGYKHNRLTANTGVDTFNGAALYLQAEQNSYLTVGPITANQLTANNISSYPLDIYATGGSTVKLAGSAITQNTFKAGYPTVSAVSNRAAGANSVIDYGLGNPDAIATTLSSKNTLIANKDVRAVSSFEENGGVVK